MSKAIKLLYGGIDSHTCHQAGESLERAGELLSQAACCLPNWYSSKEGLTGESPAVFGGGGTALLSAGESLKKRDYNACVTDLLTAACALDPIDLGISMEQVALALEKATITLDDNNDNGGGDEYDTNNKLVLDAAQALDEMARKFQEYGQALEAEVHQAERDRESAGRFLGRAALELEMAANYFRQEALPVDLS